MASSTKAIKRTPVRRAPGKVSVRRTKAAKLFCEENSLDESFLIAAELAKNCFPTLKSLKADVLEDPESDEKWIDLVATLTGSVEEVLAQFDQYLSAWIPSAPSPRGSMIRLFFNIV